MAASEGFKDFIKDQLAGFGPVTVRNMFSGAGIYADGVMFAILANDVLYLKADATTAQAFAAEGMGPFTYRRAGKAPVAMSYLGGAAAASGGARRARPMGAGGPPRRLRKQGQALAKITPLAGAAKCALHDRSQAVVECDTQGLARVLLGLGRWRLGLGVRRWPKRVGLALQHG